MSRQPIEPQPAVRKSFLIIAGVALGAALIGFVLMTFVFGGGDEEEPAAEPPVPVTSAAPAAPGAPADGGDPTAPAPGSDPTPGADDDPNRPKPGGRDPFQPAALGVMRSLATT